MRALVSIENAMFPLCILEKDTSFGRKIHHNPYGPATHQTGVRGCDVVDDLVFVARTYKKNMVWISCFQLTLEEGQHIFKLLSERRVHAPDVHDIKVVQLDGEVAILAVTSTANDSLVLVSYHIQSGDVVGAKFVAIGNGKDDDEHHINSIHVFEGCMYLTCHNHQRPGDVVKVFPDGTYEFMKLRGPNDSDYENPHNFHMLSRNKYIIGDSKNNRVVLCEDGEYVVRELGGWVRGLCVLNQGDEYLVGAMPHRGRAQKHLDTLDDVSVFLLDDMLNIKDVCVLGIPPKHGIFSIRELAK